MGAILLDNSVFDDVMMIIKSADEFYRDAHRIVYEQMVWMHSNGKAIDAVTLSDRLEQIGEYKKIGGDDLLAELANSVPHAANARYHGDIVRQKAITRWVIQSSTEIIADGYSNLQTSQELLENAEKKIFAIRDTEVSRGTIGIMAAVDEAMKMMDKAKNGGEVGWLLTGIAALDKILLGFQGSQLIVLAGRPGAGKSALAAQFASFISAHAINSKGEPEGQNESTLLISLEMSAAEYARRMIAAKAAIDSKIMKNNAPLVDDQDIRIAQSASVVASSRLRIDDSPAQTLSQIAANARRWKRKDSLGFLVIDYLQKVKEPYGKNENRANVIGRISTGLKNLAKELNIPILALCQLNRESEKEDRPPRMSDLRESGDIEQDADVVLLLHNKTPKGDVIGPVDVIVAKNRDGAEGIVPLVFDRPTSTFTAAALSGEVRAADFPRDDHRPPDEPDYDDPIIVPWGGR